MFAKIATMQSLSAGPARIPGSAEHVRAGALEAPAALAAAGEIGRHEPCPCGNGKKLKRCRGPRVPALEQLGLTPRAPAPTILPSPRPA